MIAVVFIWASDSHESKNLPLTGLFFVVRGIPVPIHTCSLNHMPCEQAVWEKRKTNLVCLLFVSVFVSRTHTLFNLNNVFVFGYIPTGYTLFQRIHMLSVLSYNFSNLVHSLLFSTSFTCMPAHRRKKNIIQHCFLQLSILWLSSFHFQTDRAFVLPV